jgi:hypothetical protein
MTTFEWLNFIIQVQAVALLDGFAFEGENEKTSLCLMLGHPWKNFMGTDY